MNNQLKLFKAFSDETRLKIIQVLLREKYICALLILFDIPQSTVSDQSTKLEELGTVESTKQGEKTYYTNSNSEIKRILSKRDFSKWKGIDRKEIEWYPIIDEKRCVGCGICVTTCSRGVFSFDFDRNKSIVAQPYNCMVGCDNCGAYCPAGAISFPQENRREFIQSLVKKYKLVVKAKQKLELEE